MAEVTDVGVLTTSPSALDRLLEACGAEVMNGRQVSSTELLEDAPAPVDLVLVALDDHSATLGLLEAFRTTRRLAQVSILVVVPGVPDPDRAAECLRAGADDYCSLHVDWARELQARLAVHARHYRHRDALLRVRDERNHLRARINKDSLTGALARSTLTAMLESHLQSGQLFAVLFVDIDHFKNVNDTFGHQVGDQVLCRVADALGQGRRAADACGRFGGEEFVLLLPGATASQAAGAAERHRRRVAELRFEDCGGPAAVTISVGVAACDPSHPDQSVEGLLSRADSALYRAKAAGRNRTTTALPLSVTSPSRDA